jgi:hypothetical protein
MSTWGSTTVYVLVETPYNPAYVAPNIVEIPILGDPAALDTAASVIQGNGRNRKQISFLAYVSAYADYQTLQTDLTNQTIRTWTGPASDMLSAVIISLGPPDYIQSDCIKFQFTIMEAV